MDGWQDGSVKVGVMIGAVAVIAVSNEHVAGTVWPLSTALKFILGNAEGLEVKFVDMNTDSIREFCMGFPHATEKLQWEDELCFKIAGRIFVMLGLDIPRLCFKCSPESFEELIEREDVRPAPYVGRYKWVMLDRLDAVPWNELQELIRQSYEMVAAKAPKNAKAAEKKKPKKASGRAGKSHRS
jgi:predicted DNA-binding protein (MmcQ/YjbR family)